MSYNLPLLIPFFEIVTAIIATIHFKKFNKTTEKYFLYFLWYTVLNEAVCYIAGYGFRINLVELYIVYDIVTFLFLIFWYQSILINKKNKRIIYMVACIFFFTTINDLLFQDWKTTSKFTNILGAFITIIGSFLYFSEILKSDKILNIKSELRFWIATGLLLFNVGFVPVEIFKETFNANSEVRIIIIFCLNLILYSCYILGFLWSKKEEN